MTPEILFSQSYSDFFSGKQEMEDSARFHLTIDNSNFFKNNEYFNKFSDGYTLIGYFLKPRIIFRPYKKLNIYAGFHLQKYSGVKQFSEIEPVFTVEYMPSKNFSIVFGELYGSVNHNLTDFVMYNEYYLTQNSENGLQLLFNNDRIISDTWLNWKQYIFKDSPHPEIMLIGTSNNINILQKDNRHSLNIKIAAVGSHVGGQINSSDEPVETIINTVSGLEYDFNFNKKYLNNINIFGLYHTSIDGSPNKRLEYIYGYGMLSGVKLSNKFLSLKVEHWYGEYYFSKFGNPMFQSISSTNNGYYEDERAFLNAHLFWTNQKFRYFKLGAGLDIYYDLYNKQVDYSFGFYIKTNFDFILKNRL